jgi:hypothetical protein
MDFGVDLVYTTGTMVIRTVSVWYHRGLPEMTEGRMAKKKAGAKKMATAAAEPVMRHARIELPDEDYQRLKAAAQRVHIPVAAYIRQAVMERIESDERKAR